MKKITGLLLALLFLSGCSPAFAGFMEAVAVPSTLLDNAPTSIAGNVLNIKDCSNVSFFVSYDETQVGASVSAAVTLEISYDGTNFFAASFYDYAGGATLQTTETISADGRYYFWMNNDLAVPYARVTITATSTDADDTALVDCYMFART